MAAGACQARSGGQPSPGTHEPDVDAAVRADARSSRADVAASDVAAPADGAPADARSPIIDGAMAAPDPARLGGVWSGSLGKLPFSFVLNEDGVVTDLSVRLDLEYDGAGCYMTFA